MSKAPISAIVVCFNEAKMLERCLNSLKFCDEIIVIDLESKDDSAALAKQFGATVISHPWVPIGEMARASGADIARNDWLIIIDPDEEVTAELADDITRAISDEKAGVISVPWFNYFGGKPLNGTVWGGGGRRKRVLMHKNRADLVTKVHSEFFTLRDGYDLHEIEATGRNWLRHYWIRNWSEFFEKHRRYLKLEGEARSARGERFRWLRIVKVIPYCFYDSYVAKKGYKDGWLGLRLSVLWDWYNFMSLISLREYQRQKEKR